MIDQRRPYSVDSLAERWSCSGSHVRNFVKTGGLGSFRYGTMIRIPAAEVDRIEGLPPASDADDEPATKSASAPAQPAPLPQGYVLRSYSSKLPDWPGAMKRKTAAAYLDLTESTFERDVETGRLPRSFILGGRPHWRKEALDQALAVLSGEDAEPVPDHIRRYEERRQRKTKI